MDPLPDDIIVRLTLDQEDGIDSRVLANAVSAIEDAARDVAREEIEAFRTSELAQGRQSELGRIEVAVDAALERVRRFDGSCVRFVQAREGSLVLTGVLALLGYWMLDKTLGESFAEGWKNSQVHRHLSDSFRELIDGTAGRLMYYGEKRFARKKIAAEVRRLRQPENGIEITVRTRRRPELPPRYGKMRGRLDVASPERSPSPRRHLRLEEDE
jgi:hypothetical protein